DGQPTDQPLGGNPMPLKNRIVPILGLLAVAIAAVSTSDHVVEAATSSGWTTTATVSPATVKAGATVTITVQVTASSSTRALVDVEVHDASGQRFQRFWDQQSFTANHRRKFTTTWAVPSTEAAGPHTVKIGVFGSGWTGLMHWNNGAASLN